MEQLLKELRRLCDDDRKDNYVYQHVCVDTGEIFYIGVGTVSKGKKHRQLISRQRNLFWKKYVDEHGPWRAEILYEDITKLEANIIETILIKKLGRFCDGGILTNKSLGGGCPGYGVKGRVLSEDTKTKIGNAKRGKTLSDEHRQHIGEGHQGLKRTEKSKQKSSTKLKEYWASRPGRMKWTGIFCETNNKTYSSYAEIKTELGLLPNRVSAVTNGLHLSHKGYKFKYIYETTI